MPVSVVRLLGRLRGASNESAGMVAMVSLNIFVLMANEVPSKPACLPLMMPMMLPLLSNNGPPLLPGFKGIEIW